MKRPPEIQMHHMQGTPDRATASSAEVIGTMSQASVRTTELIT